jgi:uncharacterized ParB-like nuclease family protein
LLVNILGSSRAITRYSPYFVRWLRDPREPRHEYRPTNTTANKPQVAPYSWDQSTILDAVARSPFGERLLRLWSGDWSGFKHRDHAILSLARGLAYWTGTQEGLLDAVVGRSPLVQLDEATWRKWLQGRREAHWGLERVVRPAIASRRTFWNQPAAQPIRSCGVVSTEGGRATLRVEESEQRPPEGGRASTFTRCRFAAAVRLAPSSPAPELPPDLSDREHAAALILHLLADRTTREFHVGCEQLGDALGVSRHTAGRVLARLCSLGVISRLSWGSNLTGRVSRFVWTAKKRTYNSSELPTMNQKPTTREAEVPLIEIERKFAQAVREQRSDAAVQEYAEADKEGEKLPPVALFTTASGPYYLADGEHRLEARKQNGKATVFARVTEYTTDAEAQEAARLHAAGANADHGLRRTPGDKRAAICSVIGLPQFATASNREIARLCRLTDHKLVTQVRRELTAAGKLTGPASSIDRNEAKDIVNFRSGETLKADGRIVPNEPQAEYRTNVSSGGSPTQKPPATAQQPAPEVERRPVAPRAEPLPNLAPEPEPEPTTAGEQEKDVRGRNWPASMVPLFRAGRRFLNDIRAMFAEAKEGVKGASTEPWGAGFRSIIPTFDKELEKSAGDVAASIPYCVCPHVNNDGVHTLPGKCKVCVDNRGWLSRHNYHLLSDAVKKLIDEVASESTLADSNPIAAPASNPVFRVLKDEEDDRDDAASRAVRRKMGGAA